MKKLTLILILLLTISSTAFAADGPLDMRLKVTSPMETTVVGFLFFDGTKAAGLSHTFFRFTHGALPLLSLDIDGTVAKEFNDAKETLGGIGAKLNYTVKESKIGLNINPSLGLTVLSNLTQGEALKKARWAVYGTLVTYKWW